MPQQPLTHLDEQGNEVLDAIQSTHLDEQGNEVPDSSEPGMLSRAWTALNEPLTTAPSRAGRAVSEYVNPAGESGSGLSYYGGKAAEFTGDLLSGLTSPLNVGTAALTGGAGLAGRAGLATLARALSLGARTAAVPVAAEGVYNMATSPTWAGTGLGALEAVGGAAGMMHTPTIRPRASTVASEISPAAGKSASEIVDVLGVANKIKAEGEHLKEKFGGGITITPERRAQLEADLPIWKMTPQEFDAKSAELNSLYDKGQNGTLTGDDLTRARQLDYELGTRNYERPKETAPSLEQQFATMMESKGATTQPVIKSGRTTINQNELATAKQVISDYDSSIDMTKMKPADIIKQGRQIDPQKFSEIPAGLRATPTIENTEARLGKPIEQATPNEIKTTVPQQDIARSISDSSKELQQDPSNWEKIRNAQRAWLTSWDFSAPGRQGLPLVLEKSYWTSFKPMFQSWKAKDAYHNVMQSIEEHPYFKPTIDANGMRGPSFAERNGLSLTDLKTHKEEMFTSQLAEKLPMVSRSERAYSAFLNKLRADTFAKLVDLAKAAGRDPETDEVLAKQIANWVNIRTGRGNIGDWGKTGNKVLNEVFFAPRLTASRFQVYNQVFNPWSYAKMDPMLRKQTLKSALGMVGAGVTLNQLARLPTIGSDKQMEQSYNPTSSDFMKAKIGPTRFDPWGGFQQPAVALAKIVLGQSTSTTPNKQGEFNVTNLRERKFGRQNTFDVAEQYALNRLAPIPRFIYSWMSNTSFQREGKPTAFDLPKELVDQITPIVAQDLWDIYQTDPSLLPYGVPAATFGVGTQTYGR